MAQQTLPIILHRDEDSRLIEQLTEFAAAIEAVIIAKLPGRGYYHEGYEAGAAAEREECAKVAADHGKATLGKGKIHGERVAHKIRARGQQENG